MSESRRRALVVAVITTSFVTVLGIGAALARARHSSGHARHGHARRGHLARHATGPYVNGRHRGLPVGELLRGTGRVSSRVIVVLRDQLPSLPADRRHVRARIAAEAGADAMVEADVARSGGRIYRRYHALNAFAAQVSARERAALQSSSQVAQVIPDTVVQLPTQDNGPVNPLAAPGQVNDAQQVCPANPSDPLLEPEALQTTHTAYMDPSIPQAQSLATGAGVKVAFFADGIDVSNPDLIRPDGSHVIIDYRDFTGEGPNAPSNSLEAFGDASSIAAQGNQVYDISTFANPAHPLPPSCNIRVRGMAPGASLIAIKVFGNANSAFNSVILQGLDYALTSDHPDVISESFGGYPIPDSTQDLTRQFNEQAVADGVTVVESTGDSGVEASPSSASSDPSVIAAGASTTFRNYAQLTQYGAQLSNGGWESDNISSVESAGFTQGGRVLDLVAPGEANWALCSPDTSVYLGCTSFAGRPSDLESFGGTSESAPLIAGGAALVIQAYRQSHGGQSPSPRLVRQLLTSTATDLHAPGVEQGAGELNALAAVQAAESVGNPAQAVGQNLLASPTQLDLKGTAGSQFSAPVQVTNVGSSPQTVTGHVREITATLSNQTGSVTLDDTTSPTFVDQFGNTVPYEEIHFTVPAGADRLLADLAWNGPQARVGLTLIDPNGRLAAYTRPQGDGNHGEVDVAHPVAGGWTGVVFRRDGTFDGPVSWQATSQTFGWVDHVYPQSITLAPGQTGAFHVVSTFPASAGDSGQDLVLTSDAGTISTVPIALRSRVPIAPSGGQFSGNLVGGNGRNGAFQPGQIDTYELQVPAGEPELTVSMDTSSSPGTQVYGSLVSPGGRTVTDADNVWASTASNPNGSITTTYHYTGGLEAFVPYPQPGLWRWVVDVVNPVGGQVLSAPYTGRVGFAPPQIQTTGVPQGRATVLRPGSPVTATVQGANPGPGTEQFFLDPRTNDRQPFSLVSITPNQGFALPVPAGTNPPFFLMPTETNAVGAFVRATKPVTFDFGFGDPDLAAIQSGNVAAGFVLGRATPGLWDIAPDELGPFDGPAPAATASAGMVALTKGFDPNASTSTGDPENQAVNPTAAAFTPLILGPGQTGTMTVTFTPPTTATSGGGHGRGWGPRLRGTLYVDVFDNVFGIAGEVAAVPYSYRVAPPPGKGNGPGGSGGAAGGSHGHARHGRWHVLSGG